MFDVLIRSTLAMLCLRYPDKSPGDISIVFRPDLALPAETLESIASRAWPLPEGMMYRASVRLGAGRWGVSAADRSPEKALAALHSALLSEMVAGETTLAAVRAVATRTESMAKEVLSAGVPAGQDVDAQLDNVLKAANYDSAQE